MYGVSLFVVLWWLCCVVWLCIVVYCVVCCGVLCIVLCVVVCVSAGMILTDGRADGADVPPAARPKRNRKLHTL